MTDAKHPFDETERASERWESDPEALKQELFAAWAAVNPDRTRQQFDEQWLAMTSETPPSATTDAPPPSWDHDPTVLERRMFEEWKALRPNGTHEQFKAEWDAVTSASDD